MKIRTTIILGFIFFFACVCRAWTQDANLRAKVEELYEIADQYTEAKNLEGSLSLLADDWEAILGAVEKEGVRAQL
jgi:hypothetical protein